MSDVADDRASASRRPEDLLPMRLEVTRKSDLAIRAIGVLAASPGRLKTADLASALDASPAFMAQVLTEMGRTGLVASSPGPTGGYRLLVDPSELSVIAVIETLEGPTDDQRCVVANEPCGTESHCAMHHAWTEARTVLIDHLRSTTVEQATAPAPGPLEVAPDGPSPPPEGVEE